MGDAHEQIGARDERRLTAARHGVEGFYLTTENSKNTKNRKKTMMGFLYALFAFYAVFGLPKGFDAFKNGEIEATIPFDTNLC